MRIRTLLSVLVITGMFFSGCKKVSSPKLLPAVAVAMVDQRDVPVYIDAIGQAISPVTVQVRPQVAGKLLEVYVHQGNFVQKGDIMYLVDPRPYQALLDQAKAQLEHDLSLLEYAEKTVERYKPVVDEDFIAILTYENYTSNAAAARAQVELDRAAVQSAQLNVDFCKIVAPVSGKISYFAVDVGNIVAVDDPVALTSIKPFSPIDFVFSVPQQQLEMIRAEQGNAGRWPFIAQLPESPDKKVMGTTYFIDNQVDQNTGTILLKGRVENEEWSFWPGEFVKIQVLYREVKDAWIAPPGAVLTGKHGPYVYTMDDQGIVDVHHIDVIIRTNEYIAFNSNEIHKGDLIVIDGQINIAPGMEVRIASEKILKQQNITFL